MMARNNPQPLIGLTRLRGMADIGVVPDKVTAAPVGNDAFFAFTCGCGSQFVTGYRGARKADLGCSNCRAAVVEAVMRNRRRVAA